jgi:triacylglycerol esterase/lipase EstA (alpha/beta hydrolase family)
MKQRLLAVLAVAAALFMVSGPAWAHHSMAMYDQTRVITLTGTVTEFRLTNPHIQILFDVKGDQGGIEHWSSIGDNPVNLRRKGWNRNTIKPTDHISISGYPAKDGRPLMTTDKIVLNGKELE